MTIMAVDEGKIVRGQAGGKEHDIDSAFAVAGDHLQHFFPWNEVGTHEENLGQRLSVMSY